MSKHIKDAYRVEEGEDVELTTDEGVEVVGVCTDTQTDHTEGVHISEQRLWFIEANDGTTYTYGILDGIAGTEESPFPKYYKLTEATEDPETFGYITEIHHE